MDPFLAAARMTFRQQQRAFETVIAGLPIEALDWQPVANANSLAVQVAHAWGAAQAWTLRAAGREMERDRAEELCRRWHRALERAKGWEEVERP